MTESIRLTPHPKFIHSDAVMFNAHFDFITVQTPGRIELPKMGSKMTYPRQFHGRRLTIQDPSEQDLVLLSQLGRQWPIVGLEISVDLRPRPAVRGNRATLILADLMLEVFACCLAPTVRSSITDEFRGYYRQVAKGFKLGPFTQRLPLASDQQLHGKNYHPEQVKVYFKSTDNGDCLEPDNHVARVEVVLREEGAWRRGLRTCADLLGFPYRKTLMPFFTHVRAAEAKRPARLAEDEASRYDELDRTYARQFERAGCGAFMRGGRFVRHPVRLRRHTPVNTRIGQALTRLEQRLAMAQIRAFSSHQ